MIPLDVGNMKEDHKFYDLLEDDLEIVEGFYHHQLEAAHKRFYELIQQLIQLVTDPHLTHIHCNSYNTLYIYAYIYIYTYINITIYINFNINNLNNICTVVLIFCFSFYFCI